MRFDFDKFEQALAKSDAGLDENSITLNSANKIFSIIWNQDLEVPYIDFDSFSLEDAYLAMRIHEDRFDYEHTDEDEDIDNIVYLNGHPFYSVDRMNNVFQSLATAQTIQSKKPKFKFI